MQSPLRVSLSGTGVPQVAASPAELHFPSLQLGSSSPPLSVSVSNDGSGAAGIGTASITGPNASDFSITSDTCSKTTLAAFSGCAISVAFNPTALGTDAATLEIPSDTQAARCRFRYRGPGCLARCPSRR